MQLNDALNIIREKFVSEVQEQENEAASKKYFEAFDKFPAVMETASQIWAAQIIAQNIQQQQAAAMQQQAAANGEAGVPNPIQMPDAE